MPRAWITTTCGTAVLTWKATLAAHLRQGAGTSAALPTQATRGPTESCRFVDESWDYQNPEISFRKQDLWSILV